MQFSLRTVIVIAVAVAACLAIVRLIVKSNMADDERRRQFDDFAELVRLEYALDLWERDMGCKLQDLDSSVVQQWIQTYKKENKHSKRSFHDFDAREAIVFWLGEWHSPPYFDFDHTRITDRDSDKWPEYTAFDGRFYQLSADGIKLWDSKTGALTSRDQLGRDLGIEPVVPKN